MKKNLLYSSVLSGILVTGFGFGNHTYAAGDETLISETPKVTTAEELNNEQSEMNDHQKELASEQIIKIHEKEEPIFTNIDKKTGIIAEVYEVKDKSSQTSFQTYASGWQVIATDWFSLHNDYKFRENADKTIAYSGGGDFGIRILGHYPLSVNGSESFITYKLYEYDPQNPDDYVGEITAFVGHIRIVYKL